MALKHSEALEPLDANLKTWVWLNSDTQTHVFRSTLHEVYPTTIYPQMWERFPKLTIKPGKLLVVPHRYYKIFTRDDSPAKGHELTMNEAIEAFSEASLTRGEEAHENKHEKKS